MPVTPVIKVTPASEKKSEEIKKLNENEPWSPKLQRVLHFPIIFKPLSNVYGAAFLNHKQY